jgi:pentatricopeptide repeat protein
VHRTSHTPYYRPVEREKKETRVQRRPNLKRPWPTHRVAQLRDGGGLASEEVLGSERGWGEGFLFARRLEKTCGWQWHAGFPGLSVAASAVGTACRRRWGRCGGGMLADTGNGGYTLSCAIAPSGTRSRLSSPHSLPSPTSRPSWLIHALAHSGRPHDAVRVFLHTRERGLASDAHACTALLTELARIRMTATARKVFDDMARAGVSMKACTSTSRTEAGAPRRRRQ